MSFAHFHKSFAGNSVRVVHRLSFSAKGCGNRIGIRRSVSRVYAFKNFGDGLLDYIEAGPKLRKWYGEGERIKEGKDKPDPEDIEEGDAVLVTDGDSPIGELVLLQLIVARLKVAALVKNPAATLQAYGNYVKPIRGSVGDRSSLGLGLQKASAVICTSGLGALPELLNRRKLDHVVLLSSVGVTGMNVFDRLMNKDQAALSEASREEALQGCSAPLTIMRVGKMLDSPGGTSEIQISKGLKVPSTSISREDVAQLLVRALQKRPTGTLRIAAESKPLGAQFKNWDQLFANLDT